MSNEQSEIRQPPFYLYAVTGGGTDATWTRIGVAWENRDGGGYSLTVKAVPLNGRIVMRKPKVATASN